jgi:hypothetical protein
MGLWKKIFGETEGDAASSQSPTPTAEMGSPSPGPDSKPMVDLPSGQESSVGQEAQSPILSDDEQISRRVAELVEQGADQYTAKEMEGLARTRAELKEIGQHLVKNGGHARMQRVYYQVEALGARAGLIDIYWDGIGEWEK